MIIYKERNNILLRINLSKPLNITIQDEHFFMFYDFSSQAWLIKFQDEAEKKDFCSKCSDFNVHFSQHENINVTKKDEAETIENKQKPDVESDTEQSKAEILQRITKMGTQLLPKPVEKQTVNNVADFEPKIEQKETERNLALSNNLTPVSNYQLPVNNYQTPAIITHSSDPLTLLLTQNIEMKYALTQLSAKVDGISSESGNSGNSQSKLKVMELKLENLLSDFQVVNKRCEQLQLENKLLKEQLKEEVNKHENTISSQNKLIEEAKTELEAKVQKEIELKSHCAGQEAIIKDLQAKLESLQYKCDTFDEEKQQYTASIDKLNEQIIKLQLTKSLSPVTEKNIGLLIKKHMNETFESIMSSFQSNQSFEAGDVQKIVGRGIKKGTLEILQALPACLNSSQDSLLW